MLIASIATFAQTIIVEVSSKGVSQVPSFGIPNASLYVEINGIYLDKKQTWSFDPNFALNMSNGQGWFFNPWIHKKWQLNKKLSFTAGAEWNLYFQKIQRNGKDMTQSVAYPTGELKLQYAIDSSNVFTADFWYTNAIPLEYGVKGSYLGMIYTRSQSLSDVFSFRGNANLFYVQYSDGLQGFAASYDASIMHKKTGLYIVGQLIHKVSAGILTNHRIGIGISRQL